MLYNQRNSINLEIWYLNCHEKETQVWKVCINKVLENNLTGPAGSVVEHPLRDREVVGSNPGRVIPKALKMVPVATLLGAQHYKESTGFFSPNKISHN